MPIMSRRHTHAHADCCRVINLYYALAIPPPRLPVNYGDLFVQRGTAVLVYARADEQLHIACLILYRDEHRAAPFGMLPRYRPARLANVLALWRGFRGGAGYNIARPNLPRELHQMPARIDSYCLILAAHLFKRREIW